MDAGARRASSKAPTSSSSTGRSRRSGRGLAAPAGALEIDGRGKHVTPGIIDAHSHTAPRRLDERRDPQRHGRGPDPRRPDPVRRRDLPRARRRHDDRQHPARLGQLDRRPEPDREVALGRRSRRPPLRRRAGGHQVRARRESQAVELERTPSRAIPRPAWASPSRSASASRRRRTTAAARTSTARPRSVKGAKPIPPQPDLQLEAIAEILEGKRTIHCHSYRKDEILQMIRSAEEFGVKIGTFQHVLEGYKVADEIARHGAGASGFSDWWAYKVEVFDAIPYAFPLMQERGVLVSFNSDSDELARRLNLEAAKAIKYGGVGARRRAGVRDFPARRSSSASPRGSARSRPARTATSSSGAAIRSRPRRSPSRPGSTAGSTSTARPTSRRARPATRSAPRSWRRRRREPRPGARPRRQKRSPPAGGGR